MLNEIFGFKFSLDATIVAGASLWSLALYLGFSPLAEWISEQMGRWLNFAERSLYVSQEEFERTRVARESQNAFYSNVLSILPFLLAGALSNYGLDITLGKSWAISVGILACVGCGIYELGRRATEEE